MATRMTSRRTGASGSQVTCTRDHNITAQLTNPVVASAITNTINTTVPGAHAVKQLSGRAGRHVQRPAGIGGYIYSLRVSCAAPGDAPLGRNVCSASSSGQPLQPCTTGALPDHNCRATSAQRRASAGRLLGSWLTYWHVCKTRRIIREEDYIFTNISRQDEET